METFNLVQCRSWFHQAETSSESVQKLAVYCALHDTPLSVGYAAAAKMISAKYAASPLKSWQLFQQGKEELEAALKDSSEEVELHYLRFSIQLKAPFFLGYRKNLQEDRKFLQLKLPEIEDLELKKCVKEILVQNT